jgi:ABC-2 type transport system permease protein
MIRYLLLETYLRNAEASFWIFFFPALMYLIFSAVFGGMGKEMDLSVGVLGSSRFFDEAVKHIGFEIKAEKFDYLDSLKDAVLSGKIDIGIDLRDFDRSLFSSILGNGKATVKIYRTDDEVSKAAAEMFEEIFSSADLEIMKFLGKVKDIKVVYREEKGGVDPKEFYLGTGVVLALLGAGIFGASFSISEMRMRGIFKYFEVTPMGSRRVFAQLLLTHIAVSIVSATMVVLAGVLKGVDFQLQRFLVPIILGSLTFTSIGVYTALQIKNYEMLTVVSNLIYFTMMFTGKLFFEVGGMFKIASLFNPVSYLVDMIRSGVSLHATLVSLIWLLASSILSILLLKRGEGIV